MIKIIADSTCDLPQEIVQKYDITILPLHIHLGEEEYLDGVSITPQEIYKWADENKTTPKTSAIGLSDTIEVLQQYAGCDVICFSISDQMSSTGNIMRMAAEELEQEDSVFVINSNNLCGGIGLLVIEAAEMIEKGVSALEIVDRIETLKQKVNASFVVDTLTYLHRGGRCNSVEAIAGSVMKLHPKIVVEAGKMEAQKKYRGKMSSVIMNYVKDMETEMRSARPKRIFIADAECDKEALDKVIEYIKELQIFEEMIVGKAGGVISSHCGPGTMGIFFIEK